MTTTSGRTRRRTTSALLAVSLAAATLLVTATSADASFPSTTNGRIFFEGLTGPADTHSQIYSVNPDGSDLQQLTTTGTNLGPDVSADGDHVVFGSDRSGNFEIWEMNPDGTDQQQITHDGASDFYPAFSPDGSQIAYRMTTATNPGDIFVANVDGSGTPTQLTTAAGLDSVAEWKAGPDGGLIVFHSSRDDADPANCSPCVQSLYTMKPDGSDQTQIVYVPGGRARFANWSPDGTKIVYEHDSSTDYQTTSNEIWTANADGSDQQVFAPTAGAFNDEAPDFSPDGSQLVWESNGDMQMAASDGTSPITNVDLGGLDVGSIDWSVTPGTVLTSRTTLAVTPATTNYGAPVTLQATVAPSAGVTAPVTGTVTFAINGTTVGSPVTLRRGGAKLTTSAAPVGADVVTATYSGDDQHTASTGRGSLQVNEASTTTTLTATPSPGTVRKSVTLIATVVDRRASGTVTFSDDGTTLGTAPLVKGRAKLKTRFTSTGSHPITAVYNGDGNYVSSTSDVFDEEID